MTHLPARLGLTLTAATFCALLPHFSRQPFWLSGLMVLLIFWRGWRYQTQRGPLGAHWLIPGALLIAGLIFVEYRSLVGGLAGVAFLAGLVSLKLFEGQSIRDARLILFLDFFCAGTHFLVSQAPWMALYSLLCTLLILACWLLLERPIRTLSQAGRLAGRLLLEGLPIACLLFVFFPRLSGPLWAMPGEKTSKSGLSSEALNPGSVSQLALDDSIAFRVTFTDRRPRQEQLYWRGPVYEYFDGQRWLPSQATWQQTAPQIIQSGPTTHYQITLEPHQQRWLLALDLPTQWPANTRLNNRLQLLAIDPVTQRERYELTSSLSWQIEEDPSYRRALQLPARGNPQARTLAAQWQDLPENERVRAALRYLQEHEFAYTLEPPQLTSANQIDEFLFESKLGFCEHFASSFTFLMRAAGLPARIVTGYQGGSFNTAGQYLIVRQADAHAWVEVWLSGQGWQRIDPTAIIAPARIQSGLAYSVPQQADSLPLMLRDGHAWIKNLRLNLDVMVHHWNQWVIGYNMRQQMNVLNRLGIEEILSTRYLAYLTSILATILAWIGWKVLLPALRLNLQPEQRLYERFCRKLARKMPARQPSEAPVHFATRAATALPKHATQIHTITQLYLDIRYGQRDDKIMQLRDAVRQFNL